MASAPGCDHPDAHQRNRQAKAETGDHSGAKSESLQMKTDHQNSYRCRTRHQTTGQAKHCNLAGGYLLADKAAFDILGVSQLVGVLISSIPIRLVGSGVMRVVMPMVVFGETHFETMDMISMPHAQNSLEVVGLRYFLHGLQENSGRLEVEDLIRAVSANCFNSCCGAIVKNLGSHGVVISVKAEPRWHARFKNFQFDDFVPGVDNLTAVWRMLVCLCGQLIATRAQEHPD